MAATPFAYVKRLVNGLVRLFDHLLAGRGAFIEQTFWIGGGLLFDYGFLVAVFVHRYIRGALVGDIRAIRIDRFGGLFILAGRQAGGVAFAGAGGYDKGRSGDGYDGKQLIVHKSPSI